MKRNIYIILLGLGIVIPTLFLFGKEDKSIHNRGCTGSAYCTACSNCSGCGHCNSGGSCGVCSTSFTSKKSYSSNSSKKKSKKSKSINSYSTKTNKVAVKYYNGNSTLRENNFLYTIYKTVNIRKGPGTNYSILESVKLNTKLIYLTEEGNWYKVKVYNTGTEGYVYKQSVK